MKRVCKECSVMKPIDMFHRRGSNYRWRCAQCMNESYVKRRADNLEHYLKREREYRFKNKERVNESRMKWLKKNPTYKLEYTKKVKGHKRDYDKEYNKKNKAHIALQRKEYRANNIEKIRAYDIAKGKRRVINMPDYYLRTMLTRDSSLLSSEIPQKLVELKRLELILKRKARSLI